MGFEIEHDYDAVHSSGQRSYHDIIWLVIHDMESANYNGAAEGVGVWFEQLRSGASTQFGVDNNSIQQYLGLRTIPWGAPGANLNGVHIEQMGVASWTHDQWLARAKPTIERTAWLLGHLHVKLQKNGVNVPLRRLTLADIRAHNHGVVTHHQITDALPGGSHTDPGPGYPMDYLIKRARYWRYQIERG